jgi:hypothetical protein
VAKATGEHGAITALRNALVDLPASSYSGDQKTLGPLHEKVCAVVDLLKAEGMAPEHVLLAVKGVAYEAQMDAASDILVERMVKWCIEQYFRT